MSPSFSSCIGNYVEVRSVDMLNSIKLSVPLLAFVDCLNSPHTPLGSIISHRSSHILCSKNAVCVKEVHQRNTGYSTVKSRQDFFQVKCSDSSSTFLQRTEKEGSFEKLLPQQTVSFSPHVLLSISRHMFDSEKNASAIPMFPCRSTFPSSGRYAGHCFAADSTGWAGLRGSIIAAQEFNLFGIPYVGSYICGDNSTLDDVELCVRWYQLGAFYSLSRCSRFFLTHLHKKSSWRSRTTREDLFHIKRNYLITLD